MSLYRWSHWWSWQRLRGEVTTSLLKQQHVVININESSSSLFVFHSVEPASCWVQVFGVSFSKLLHSKPSSALNRLLNTEGFQAGTLSSKVTSFILYSDWVAAVCQRSAVLLWPQLWSPTPPIWESWSWVETSCRIQEWSCCVVFWRVHTVDWRLWGQTPFVPSVLRLIWCESCGDTKLHQADIILIHTEYLKDKVCFLLLWFSPLTVAEQCWAAHLKP